MTAASPPVALVDYLRLAADYLERAGSETARLDAEVLLGHVLGMERISLYVNFDRPLEPDEVARYREALRRRGRGEPVAYIVGRRAFRTLHLKVTPAVLIPRPETELLVDAVLDRLAGEHGTDEADGGREPLRIADIGTGSGAIAVALAVELPCAEIAAVDMSEDALAVARDNAAAYDVLDRVAFFCGDLMAPLLQGAGSDACRGRLDAVVANPPYIASGELAGLTKDVVRFEPRLALDGGPDGLALYRRLIPQAAEGLREGGLLALEIGADQGDAVAELLRRAGGWRDVSVGQDYAGLDRVVTATKGP